MKKLFALLALIVCLSVNINAIAQDKKDEKKDTAKTEKKEAVKEEQKAEEAKVEETATTDDAEKAAAADASTHQVIKDKFIEGDWRFMAPILVCMIFGLAIAVERIISLTLSTTNTKKLVEKIESALQSGGVDAAKEVARNTRGPVASIFVQGLMRMSEGIEVVEKSVIAYGSVEMGKLEKGLVWISLFIALAPMLGFFGTVVGMIFAFDEIERAGDISPTIVAGGIKVALITTVAGLVVAMILQVLYNYLVNKIDSITSQMEESSISLIDVLIHHEMTKK
ncbi:MAG: MotA/TolQ/ExbB proton channel family protein [Cytophagales bacterium]|nr:MAG: MotA/TolQ/ExbB proton channel family protein [Cytophagales bacterium]